MRSNKDGFEFLLKLVGLLIIGVFHLQQKRIFLLTS